MAVLGRVVSRPQPGQGRDVVHQVRVPESWLRRGNVLLVTLPRLLRCAACDGGGCDRCERRGALAVRERDAAAEVVRVELSQDMDPRHMIRIPERGACAAGRPELRGSLLLCFEVGPEPVGAALEAARSPVRSRVRLVYGAAIVLVAMGAAWWVAGGAPW